ncbi:hypothetical protein LZG74_11265 [Dyadobacter sp. CY327]|uniref:hypothetical protein n=1 Tax=Dyadobacter sp. CY327 TaxID=2907301 RepID=UPI001F3D4A54|nr:hypothetical protein [Dyadobacter sp. CY327]MCE7070886.1 hypothetical protein [Dyadobacter sp. CY327]
MVSQNLKNVVARTMSKMEVVPVRRARVAVIASDSQNSGVSIDELKDKYFRKSGQDSGIRRHQVVPEENNSVEVAIIRKKGTGQDSGNASESRTVIYSDKDGMIGSQG